MRMGWLVKWAHGVDQKVWSRRFGERLFSCRSDVATACRPYQLVELRQINERTSLGCDYYAIIYINFVVVSIFGLEQQPRVCLCPQPALQLEIKPTTYQSGNFIAWPLGTSTRTNKEQGRNKPPRRGGEVVHGQFLQIKVFSALKFNSITI